MTSETPDQEKISPSENPLKPPLEIVYSLGGMFVSTLGLILMGYMHGKMNINAVIENLK